MKPKTRFIKSVVSASQESAVDLPWTRGARRKAFIAKRAAQANALRRSA